MPYDGMYRTWNENGDLVIEQTYKEGKLFDESGKPMNGIVETYDPVRKMTNRSNYADGRLNGVTKVYDESGNLVAEIHFQDGNLHGEMIVFNPLWLSLR